jgi:AcrR family transcriptional regulator
MARTTTRRSDETRRSLVTEARRLFGEQGYAGTAINDVVQAVGLTKGALYHHFRDKDDLFRSVVEEVKGDVTARAGASFYDPDTIDELPERVLAACLALVDAYLDPAIRRITVTDARAVFDATSRRDLDSRYEVSLIRGAFRSSLPQGSPQRQMLGPLAHVVAGAVFEACALVAEADDPVAARAEVAAILRLLIDGVLTGSVTEPSS